MRYFIFFYVGMSSTIPELRILGSFGVQEVSFPNIKKTETEILEYALTKYHCKNLTITIMNWKELLSEQDFNNALGIV